MASIDVHLQQADLNERAALDNRIKHPHVCIIMCFYAALHYVEAYAAWRGDDIYQLHSGGLSQHNRRSQYVDNLAHENRLIDLSLAYEKLYQASMKARYLKGIRTDSACHFKVASDFYIKQLETVKVELRIDSLKDPENR
jgi:hypothetical protein